jgi:carbamoyltransferase
MRTEMDFLVMGNLLFSKTEQPEWKEAADWKTTLQTD